MSDRPSAAPARARLAHRPARRTAIVMAFLGALLAVPATSAAPAFAARSAPTAASSTTADATTGFLEGVDVSHWQNTIDWSKVAAAGKRFAIIKASESTTYVDPLYATNRARAQAAGMWTGAYHFAQPNAAVGDALAEADHFVATLSLGRGDLIPALDLEQAGGLSVAALQTWVSTWLGEVTRKVGVRPMIYTSPSFWKTYMGNSQALADAGYRTLWIAHWGVAAPTVPANNWGGRGWTFWQYTSCGAVPGISGCVDLDRFNGTDLLPHAYSIFSLSTGSAQQVKQGQTASAATVGIARTNFPSEVALTVSGLPAGTTAAFNASPTTETSSALHVTTQLGVTPTGTYPLKITGTGQGLTRTTGASLVVADGTPPRIVAPVMQLQRNSIVASTTSAPVYTVWSASDASGVSSFGLQRSINGSAWTTVRLPSATATAVWQSIPMGSTTVQRARATDRMANTSAWTAGPGVTPLVTQTGSSIHYSTGWRTYSASSSLGGSQAYASKGGAFATYTFTAASIGWVATKGPNRGYAKVYVDGSLITVVNLYSSTWQWRRVVWTRNWTSNTTHTVKVVVSGTVGHPTVDIDGFIRLWKR